MFKTNKEFVDDACGKNNKIIVEELTAKIIREDEQNIEIKFNKVLPTIMKNTDTFGIMKIDFDKWFSKI